MGKAVKVNPISNAEVADRYLRVVEKRVGKAVRPYRIDGYVNLVNRYGTSKDSSEHYNFQPEPTVPDDVLSVFYEGNGLFAKIIDAPAEEALKKGFTLDGVSDQSVIDFAYESLDELDWEETAMTALKWARLFGGSIAVLLINDGRGLEEPLDWKSIKSIDDIRIYDRSVIQPDYSSMFSYDPTDPFGTRGSRLGMPEYYHITSRYGSFTVHDSRCLVFQNGILPENCTNSVYQLWGMPEYVRLRRAIRSTELAHESAPKMLDKSVQPIYKAKNLANLLSSDEGETILLKRLQAIDLARGMLDSIAIDSDGEDYDFKSFQLAGVADIIDATCNYLSALTSIPQTILFGRSPAGMNSTGQSDMENYYNYVERIQKRMLRSNLRYLLSVIFQAGLYTKEVEEVPKIKIAFNSLWSATEKEQAELEQMKASIQQVKAQTAQIYVDMSAIDPSEVRQKLASGDEFSVETMLDDYSDDELFENTPQQEEQAATAETQDETATKGNSPDAAPEATKLPQDMDDSEMSAHNDSSEMDGGPGENGVTMTINVPSGFGKSMSISSYSTKPDEAEVLLNAGSTLRIKSNNGKEIECDVVDSNKDGGEGSGNWGHEGVEGQFGGSAPGGGNHNRMTDKNGGYTSFSKEKKRFATPHKVTSDELDKCPDGSKISLEHDGKRVTYEKNKDGTFTSNSGVSLSVDEVSEKLSEYGKDAAIYTPDSASPNYSIKRECYSNERKAAAPRTESEETVDSILRKNTEKVWQNADEFTKDSLYSYTGSGYREINSKLRDGTANSDEDVKKKVDAITEAISESKLEHDMWLARGTNQVAAACFLGISEDAVIGEEEFDPASLVGKTVSDDAFVSCGSTGGTGYDDKFVNYSIYCPTGTEALYAEPFARHGYGGGREWNGDDGQEDFSNEFETILQRGTKFKITNVYRDRRLYVELEVVSQKYEK